jgi:hypothetical protein
MQQVVDLANRVTYDSGEDVAKAELRAMTSESTGPRTGGICCGRLTPQIFRMCRVRQIIKSNPGSPG